MLLLSDRFLVHTTRIALSVLVLAAVLPASAPGAFGAQGRTERWTTERLEKAESLAAPEPNLAERLLAALETSLDEGLLGRDLAGLAVFQWLILLAVLLAAGMLVIWSTRLRRKSDERANRRTSSVLPL